MTMDECTVNCRSRCHAKDVFAAITLGSEHEDKVLKYLQVACHNINVNKDTEGRTALHLAASLGRMKIIDWLVKHNSQTSCKDAESGYSPTHRAAYFGRLNALRYFVSKDINNLFLLDNDNLSSIDHLIQDRLHARWPDPKHLCEIYVWGTNSNYTLGLSSNQSRDFPELLETFRKENDSVAQVAMSKFHTLFVTKSGNIFSCGHGHGGRLGQDTEHAVITPRKLKPLILSKATEPEVCIQAAVAMDHTILLMESGAVWSCGKNQFHQLGHNPPPLQLLSPKCISTFSDKTKSITIQGICTNRYHSVFWNSDRIYTCGLNGGQLGHLKGDRTIATPKQVTSLLDKDMTITHVAASFGATAVCTKKGEVYVLHEYQCRKIASKQFELAKVEMIGGNLDPQSFSHPHDEVISTTLKVVLLTKAGKIYTWSESQPVLTKCIFRLGRQLIIRDVSLNSSSMILVTREGEAFYGSVARRSNRKSESAVPVQESKSWVEFTKREQCDQINVKRIPGIYTAVAATSDPEGKNFAVIQNSPSIHMAKIPKVLPSQLASDYKQLLNQGHAADNIHDLIFQVGHRHFYCHRLIIATREGAFYKQHCENSQMNETETVVISGVPADVMQLILEYIYFGVDAIIKAGPAYFRKLNLTGVAVEKASASENCAVNREKTPEKKNKKSNTCDDSIQNVMKCVQNCCKKLAVNSLAKSLEKIKVSGDRFTTVDGLVSRSLELNRKLGQDFYDVRICSEDGKEFKAHRVVLSARLEYFRAMFGYSWAETTSDSLMKLPVHSSILEVILDFLYGDEAPKVEKADDVEWIGNVLVAADQLLMDRLVSICESSMANLLTLKNVCEILEFADIYNAPHLKTACMHFICLNLPAVVESRSWDCCSEHVMEDLTEYYRNQFHPKMAYRCITPSSTAPSIEQIEFFSASVKTEKVVSKEPDAKQKSRRKSWRKISESKERHLSTSSINSDSFEGEVPLEKVELVEKPDVWHTVGKHKKASNAEPKQENVHADLPNELPRASETNRKLQPVEQSTANGSRQPDQKPATPMRNYPSLYDVALVCQTGPSPPKNQPASKKFPKVSQKQRKLNFPPSPSTPKSTKTWDTLDSSQTPSPVCFASILKEEVVTSPVSMDRSNSSSQTPLRQIMDSEKVEKRNRFRLSTKPLKFTLLEEEAMEDLRRFYQVEDCHDEWIEVEREAVGPVATPVWLGGNN